ncbi:MAG: hypothetical protein K6A67_02610 [Bacteroidales bacterium]|nr:hypothetical protein [Bacteroidales bacterium]
MTENTEKYIDYIQRTIISHLEWMMDGGSQNDETNVYIPPANRLPHDSMYKSVLHAMMEPYYRMYLYGETQLCKPNMESIRWEMKRIIDEDDLFGQWASGQDLITSAECWGENMKRIDEAKRINQYFYILETLLQKDCVQDWVELSKKLKEILFKSEVYSDYKTDEVLCVLHAFTMIMQQDWDKAKKAENLELLKRQWLFMKHYYSVMTRHIVGVKWTKISDVANTVMTSSRSFLPHIHIFYCGLMDCADELNLNRKHRRELEKVILAMQDVVNRSEPSEILYELCDTLFPEDFQRMLREHRPKSYKEVEDESRRKDELIKQLDEQKGHLRNELEKTKNLLQSMIESSIPIEDVDAELMKYPPSMAWELLCDLNKSPVLNGIDAWRNAYPSLLVKYRDRLNDSMNQQKEFVAAMKSVANRPTNTYNYASGATHDDNRRQIMLGEERAKLLKETFKKPTYEQ